MKSTIIFAAILFSGACSYGQQAISRRLAQDTTGYGRNEVANSQLYASHFQLLNTCQIKHFKF